MDGRELSGRRTHERTTADALRADLAAAPDAQLLVWRDADGELLGHVWLEPQAGGVWYLGLLSVRPDRQDQKRGRALLGAAEAFAQDRGAQRIRLTVINVRDTLIAWYQRRGYGLTGEVRPFPYCDDRFGRPRRDDLSFVVLERGLWGLQLGRRCQPGRSRRPSYVAPPNRK